MDLAQLEAKRGNEEEAAKHFQNCAKGPALICGRVSGAAFNFIQERGKPKGSQETARASCANVCKAQEGFAFCGFARFELASEIERTASFEPLILPEKVLEKRLAARLAFFEKLTKLYLRVVEVGGPWAVEALNRLGFWTFRLADEIDELNHQKKRVKGWWLGLRKPLPM